LIDTSAAEAFAGGVVSWNRENDRGPPGTGHIDWSELSHSLAQIGYGGWISLESFTPHFEKFSEMMHSWRPLAHSQDEFAKEALRFLKEKFSA